MSSGRHLPILTQPGLPLINGSPSGSSSPWPILCLSSSWAAPSTHTRPGIQDYFLANQGARYLHLTRQYHNLKQGDLWVSNYACRLKALADGLADTSAPVSNPDLTMQFLHGLDGRFDTIRTILGDTVSLPPFDVARSRVDLAEYNINLRASEAVSAALTISGGSGSDHGDRGDRAPSSGRGSGGNRGGHRGRGRGRTGGRGRGRPDSGGHGQGQQPPQPGTWTGYFAPYGMALPAPRPGWVPPNAAGVLGPRPGVHSQAYPVMFSGPSPSYPLPPAPAPYPPGAPTWDQAALFQHAYSQNGLPALGANWILDSGASTHVTGNSGDHEGQWKDGG